MRARIILVRLGNRGLQVNPPAPTQVAHNYQWDITATGPAAPYRVDVAGVLPVGLTFDPDYRRVYGRPAVPGRYPLTVTVTGRDRIPVVHRFVLIVIALSLGVVGTLMGGRINEFVTGALNIVGGVPEYRLRVEGAPPPGVSFALNTYAVDGSIGRHIVTSGLATVAGSYPFVFIISDAAGTESRIAYTITIGPERVSRNYVTRAGARYVTTAGGGYITVPN